METKKGWGCGARGSTEVLAPGARLGMVPWSNLRAPKKDDPQDKGLCCPAESGPSVGKLVARCCATPPITQLCQVSYREGDLETPKF